MWWMMLGCGLLDGGEALPTPGTDEPTVAEPGATPQPSPAEEAPAAVPAAELAGEWVVVVGSASEAAPGLPDLSALQALDPPREALVVDSSAYSKLAPCLKVAVAAHTADRKAIFADLKVIRAAGIDAYVKPVGEATGLLNHTDSRCLAGRAPEVCPGDVFFAETWGEHVYVPVGLSGEDSAAALQQLGTLVPLDDNKRAWAVGLPLEQAGSLTKGSPVTVTSRAGTAASCGVTRFVGLVRGEPHFGYLQEGEPTEPGCGEPIVAAELACDLKAAAFAVKGETSTVAVPTSTRLTAEQTALVTPFVEKFPAWVKRKAQAQSEADALGEELVTKVELTAYTLGEKLWVDARVTALTGEGMDYCGMEDVYESGSLLLTLEGELIKSSLDILWIEATEGLSLVDVDGDGIPERRLERFGQHFGPAVIDGRNQQVCRVNTAYCSSPC